MKLSEIHKQVGGFPFRVLDEQEDKIYTVEAMLDNGSYAATYKSHRHIFSTSLSPGYKNWQLVSPKPAPRKLYAYEKPDETIVFNSSDKARGGLFPYPRAPEWDIEYGK